MTLSDNRNSNTRFQRTIQARIERDPAFGGELLRKGAECLLSRDLETGKSILRDYINATIGFKKLGGLTRKPPKSLMRMCPARPVLPVRRDLPAMPAIADRQGSAPTPRVSENNRRSHMASLDWSQCPAVESVPGKVSGAWVFRGTRVPVSAIFENLKSSSIDEVLENFHVTREQVQAVLDFAAKSAEPPLKPSRAA